MGSQYPEGAGQVAWNGGRPESGLSDGGQMVTGADHDDGDVTARSTHTRRVIHALGGPKRLARLISDLFPGTALSRSAIARWQFDGQVPSARRPQVVRIAAEQGLHVDFERLALEPRGRGAEPGFCTIESVAARWDMEREAVLRLIEVGRLPCYDLGGHHRLSLDDVRAFEEQARMHGVADAELPPVPRRVGAP
jgi:excisionase family DNA binding protein